MEETEADKISKAVTSGCPDPQESSLSTNELPAEGKNNHSADNSVFLHENQDGAQTRESEKPARSLERSTIDDINPSKCEGCFRFIKTARFQVYLSHFLSSWGDRMWMFSAGLFLMEVTPGSLRLAAIYGAAIGVTVILAGAPVGRLVDRTNRLRMAQVSLCIQNLMVCLCAVILVFMTTERSVFEAWDGWALIVAEILVIFTACIAEIGTLGSKLSIEKDWIIVICGQDKGRLANMNSVLRSLDLGSSMVAPVIVGTVMSSIGNAAGGIVIASWNIGSLMVEYGLLHYLFYSNEDLQKPKASVQLDTKSKHTEGDGIVDDSGDGSRWQALKARIISAWGAWILYMQHPVRDAGLGLSLLYMTVIAFDNYSRGFVFESGVPESVLGVLTAIASLFGIAGSLLYPRIRIKIGMTKTGLVGFCAETFCLLFCVASVFAPGSPFDASALLYGNEVDTQLEVVPSATPTILYDPVVMPEVANASVLVYEQNITRPIEDKSNTEVVANDFTSVTLLLIGIMTSRTGLWIADLSITQVLQEQVNEGDRGAINGVQSSLNQFFGLMRSILLIILPTRATYGFLIILSFLFVSFGWALYGVYARRELKKVSIKSTESEEQQQQQQPQQEECV